MLWSFWVRSEDNYSRERVDISFYYRVRENWFIIKKWEICEKIKKHDFSVSSDYVFDKTYPVETTLNDLKGPFMNDEAPTVNNEGGNDYDSEHENYK